MPLSNDNLSLFGKETTMYTFYFLYIQLLNNRMSFRLYCCKQPFTSRIFEISFQLRYLFRSFFFFFEFQKLLSRYIYNKVEWVKKIVSKRVIN